MQVFISHSSDDKPIARKILKTLINKGLEVWLDEAEIRVGDSIPDKIAEGINSSEILCILISKNSASSKWVNRELNSFMPRFISDKCALIPCKLDKTGPPTLIADIKYADFSQNFEHGINDLLNAVKLREEIILNEKTQTIKKQMFNELSNAELAFTAFQIHEKRNYLFIGDRRTTKAPYTLLDKLCKIGILDYDADRYERLYSFTPEGARAIEIIYKNDADHLNKLRKIYEDNSDDKK